MILSFRQSRDRGLVRCLPREGAGNVPRAPFVTGRLRAPVRPASRSMRDADARASASANLRIAHPGQPAGLPLGQFTDVSPKCLGEDDLRQLCERRARSTFAVRGVSHREPQGILQPLAGGIVADVDVDERAFAALGETDRETLRGDLVELWASHNRTDESDRTVVDSEYLEVAGVRG